MLHSTFEGVSSDHRTVTEKMRMSLRRKLTQTIKTAQRILSPANGARREKRKKKIDRENELCPHRTHTHTHTLIHSHIHPSRSGLKNTPTASLQRGMTPPRIRKI